ncbi:MAG: NADP oxidoreductase [Xanthomonadales bacterium]|nr:NADP oxidoreductase [Xanthomonadales bacterium]NIX12901.1 NADP oxidoreductase [Xanthomonadales bacterium]
MSKPLKDRTQLLDYLWRAQDEHGYIRHEDMEECTRALDISIIEVEGVVSFYHFFKRRPAGHIRIFLNRSIVSECKGFDRIRDAFERATGAKVGGVDPSGQFGLFETACIGLSDLEPAALIDFYPFTNLNSIKVRKVIGKLKQGASPADICDPVPDHVRWTPGGDRAILLREYKRGTAGRALAGHSPESVIAEVKRSGLRGMGGAFFPTGMKWEFCRHEPGRQKYIVCNADEGEPGTFKDRVLMNAMPGLMLEGMIVAAYAVGASKGLIYLRAEYRWLRDKLQHEIEHFRKINLLGNDISGIKGFNFDIRLQLGAGAYVCGEETALLNSMEGKRGEPRNKRFFPTQRGFLQKPTVVNNVETFCAAARIMQLGAERFLATGTPESPGTKLLSVSGDCRHPGIYEIAWGTTVKEVLELCDADRPHFIQVSGPSGECISMEEVDRRIALDDLPCGGSFMIFNRSRDILQILRNFTSFFKHESCGLCTPCRAGNFIIEKKLDLFAANLAQQDDVADIRSWGEIMKMTCRCGLGRNAPNAMLMAQQKFPGYFGEIVNHNPERLSKGFDLEAAAREYERFSS